MLTLTLLAPLPPSLAAMTTEINHGRLAEAKLTLEPLKHMPRTTLVLEVDICFA
jgi:hypothetical protein